MTNRVGNHHAHGIVSTFLAVALLVVACELAGCGGSSGSVTAASPSQAASSQDTQPAQSAAPSSAASNVEGSGGETSGAAYTQPDKIVEVEVGSSSGGEPVIDASHAAQGYVVAQASSPARLKFQVSCNGETYNYDLPNDGSQSVFPVNMGNGEYLMRIMQNTSGSNYVELFSDRKDVVLDSEFSPFLVANQFCIYDAASACVAKARELTASAANEADVVKVVCEYVAGSVTYDNAKAAELSTSSGYVPDPDSTLAQGSGICFDYASLSAAMLRSMGIPTKIITGYVGQEQIYHAWIMVYIDGAWQTALFTVNPNTWSRCDVTFASTGASASVGDASSYTDRYTY